MCAIPASVILIVCALLFQAILMVLALPFGSALLFISIMCVPTVPSHSVRCQTIVGGGPLPDRLGRGPVSNLKARVAALSRTADSDESDARHDWNFRVTESRRESMMGHHGCAVAARRAAARASASAHFDAHRDRLLDSDGLPKDSDGIPKDSDSLPKDSDRDGLPKDSDGLPKDSDGFTPKGAAFRGPLLGRLCGGRK